MTRAAKQAVKQAYKRGLQDGANEHRQSLMMTWQTPKERLAWRRRLRRRELAA